ncbi:hypothetical protein KW789_02135 [Candidatus Saccharibacteria bacterium]|nr:hypothetical protein [Candidatus Saccharibacteria bacterium]
MHEVQPEEQPQAEAGFTAEEAIKLLGELKAEGIDFEEEDFEHLRDMPPDEVLEYFILTLEAAGQDAESILLERGIVSSIEENPEEVKHLQNQGEGAYSTQEADAMVQDEDV